MQAETRAPVCVQLKLSMSLVAVDPDQLGDVGAQPE